jgi:lyso-ornithine lipid O-acyltransferase
MGTLRALFIVCVLTVVTLPLMLAQLLLLAVGSGAAASLPVFYHRLVCRLVGVRVVLDGRLSQVRPLLIASNHVSWLDISVLASIAPLSFIAKSEVASWPVFGWLAKLQRSVFVDRNRRANTRQVNAQIAGRLRSGDVMVLFAEGTSSDGNRVLPFRSALLGAAHELACDGDDAPVIHVQPVALVYTRLNGLPMGHQHRPVVAWHGDLELAPHLWRLLKAGSIDVTIAFGQPIPLTCAADRKSVAGTAELRVRDMASALLAGRLDAARIGATLSVTPKTG